MNVNERFVHFLNISFDFRVFGDLWNHFWPQKRQKKNSKIERNVRKMNKTFFLQRKNERREQNIHFHWTEMNAVNETFIWKERLPNPGLKGLIQICTSNFFYSGSEMC